MILPTVQIPLPEELADEVHNCVIGMSHIERRSTYGASHSDSIYSSITLAWYKISFSSLEF